MYLQVFVALALASHHTPVANFSTQIYSGDDSSAPIAENAGATDAGSNEAFERQAAQPAYTPLTARENYQYSFDRVFSPGKLALFGLKAVMDQERGVPEHWGQGAGAYGERYADHFGRALVRQHLAFAVRAMDGEDPRYEPSGETGVWKRSRYAITRTFLRRNHNGELMPAWSRFVADFGTPFIAETWEEEHFSRGRALRDGAGGIGFAVASNLGTEFWPDIRHRFLRR